MAKGDELSLDFRRRQFAEPCPVRQLAQTYASTSSSSKADKPEAQAGDEGHPSGRGSSFRTRVILHFDVDCFYAQCEVLRDPSLRGKPVAVFQKYLVVTCTYEARAHGVTKLMNTKEALKRCPSLILVCGEDLSPYKAFSKKAEKVLEDFGIVERLGMDEFYVDCTDLVKQRLEVPGSLPENFAGFTFNPLAARPEADTSYRPQDLRSASTSSSEENMPLGPDPSEETRRLAIGSHIASEARLRLKQSLGLRCSAGISVNKLISKLCGGLHKPDNQTIMLFRDAGDFMAQLPLRVIRGVGAATEERLRKLGVVTCEDMRAKKTSEISKYVTKGKTDLAERLKLAAHGDCRDPVVAKGPPKSVSVEDSFKSLCGLEAVGTVLRSVLVPDLLVRLSEDRQDYGRKPKNLTVTYRTTKMRERKHFARKSLSSKFPTLSECFCHNPKLRNDALYKKNLQILADACLSLVRKGLGHQNFTLTLLNVRASFGQDTGGATAGDVFRSTLADVAEAEAEAGEEGGGIPDHGAQGSGGTLKLEEAHANAIRRRNYGHSPGKIMSKHQARMVLESGGALEVPQASPGGEEMAIQDDFNSKRRFMEAFNVEKRVEERSEEDRRAQSDLLMAAIGGSSREEAEALLKGAGGDLERAANAFFERETSKKAGKKAKREAGQTSMMTFFGRSPRT